METGLVNVRKTVIGLAKHVLTYTATRLHTQGKLLGQMLGCATGSQALQDSSHSLQLSGTSLGVGSS